MATPGATATARFFAGDACSQEAVYSNATPNMERFDVATSSQ
jgi:hypothetical protein